MNIDANTRKYLDLFADALQRSTDAIQKLRWLDDVRRCPEDVLKLHFLENGLVYPDFPEATSTIKRNVLLNSEEIHAKRFTVAGLLQYIGYFLDAGVSIDVNYGAERKILALGSSVIGLPNVEMLDADACFHLYKDQPMGITITFEDVSAQMREWFEKTIKYELPFGDSAQSVVTLYFV